MPPSKALTPIKGTRSRGSGTRSARRRVPPPAHTDEHRHDAVYAGAPPTPAALVRAQRMVGNRAVTSLVDPVAQRAPTGKPTRAMTGRQALEAAAAGTLSWARCWIVLSKMSSSRRMALYRRTDHDILHRLLTHEESLDERLQGRFAEELNSLIAPPASTVLLELVPDSGEAPAPQGGVWPMGEVRARVKGKLVMTVPARGGPWMTFADKQNKGHTAGPTKTGTFTLSTGHAIVTSSWRMSQIANGTPLKDNGKQILFQRDGKWIPTSALAKPISRVGVLRTAMAIELKRQVKRGDIDAAVAEKMLDDARADPSALWPAPDTWELNDFGTEGFVLEGSDGDIIHTTQFTDDPLEALTPGNLEFSHGCIHLLAADRDALIEAGLLRGGVKIEVHPYDPAKLTRWAPL